jgi:hypothetical protein
MDISSRESKRNTENYKRQEKFLHSCTKIGTLRTTKDRKSSFIPAQR